MDKKKKYNIIFISLISVLFAFFFMAGYFFNIVIWRGYPSISSETQIIKNKTREAVSVNEQLEAQLEDIDTKLSDKETENNYYMENYDEQQKLQEEITDLKNRSAQLDEEISQKREKADSIGSLTSGKTGAQYPLDGGKKYTVPQSVPKGRYIAKGQGTITVLSPSGTARLSQNLDVAPGHSHTFDLYEKETITTTGDVMLTEIK